ncbi:MAG: hypothetical protein ACRC7O_12240 [Fimbriiglobus sp.]
MMPRDARFRRLLDAVLLVTLVVGSHRLYRWSPGVPQMTDGCYSLAVTELLLTRGTVRLDAALPADSVAMAKLPGFDPNNFGLPYHCVRVPADAGKGLAGGVYYGYPLGSSLLSAPAVAYYRAARGLTCLGPDGYVLTDPADKKLGEIPLHLRVAALVTAAAVGVFFLILRAFVPAGVAALLAAGFATGSMAWSTLSRSMWSHTWAVLLTALAVLALIRLARRAETSLRSDVRYGLGLGTLLFGMYFVRPQTAISALGVLAYLLFWNRRSLAVTIPTGLAWVGVLAGWSLSTFGTPLPPSLYSSDALNWKDPAFRFAGLLASPSRGLLVFCPYLLAFASLLIAYRKSLPERRLLLPAGIAIGGYVVMFTGYLGWHAGYSYGPRYFSDVLPWFVLVGGIAVGGWLTAAASRWRKILEAVVLVACFAWAGFAHSRGAISVTAWEWNYSAHTNEEHERLATDWAHPQFLAGLTFTVKSDGKFVELSDGVVRLVPIDPPDPARNLSRGERHHPPRAPRRRRRGRLWTGSQDVWQGRRGVRRWRGRT